MEKEIALESLNEVVAQLPGQSMKAGTSWGLHQEFDARVYWLKTGLVKVGSCTAEGQEGLRYLCKAETLIGEMAMLDKSQPEDFAVAITDCEVVEVKLITLKKLFGEKPELNLWLMELMRKRLKVLEKRLKSVLFLSSGERVLAFLEEYLQEFGDKHAEYLSIPNYLSHRDIAQFTSTSRQTVNRILTQLRKQGVLDYNKESLWIKNQILSLGLNKID